MRVMYIRRRALEARLSEGGRLLLYGRRKTGKTTLARKTLSDWRYFYVKTGGQFHALDENETYPWKYFRKILESEERVIIDEFHRASEDFFVFFHAGEGPRNIVLITSTLHYFWKFTRAPEAPLKGLFREIMVGLLSPLDLLLYDLDERALPLYVEPTFVGEKLERILESSLSFSNSLLEEVFTEEEIALTKRYLEILRAVAVGKYTTTRIARYLYQKGVLPEPNTGLIAKYVETLIKAGFLEGIKIFRNRKRYLRHISPVTEFAFYMDEKYGFYESLSFSGPEFLMKVWQERVSFTVERFFERFFSELYGLRPVKVLNPEIDITLLRFNRPYLIAEVKWKHTITRKEIEEVEKKFREFERRYGRVERKVLVVSDAEKVPDTKLEVWDIEKAKEAVRSLVSG